MSIDHGVKPEGSSLEVDESVSPNELVRIDSYLDLPRADLARIALAREEIPAAFGNANFLSWFWHYSNAVGGVTIYVRRCEAELARGVLAAASTKITESLPPWICPSCGQRVAGQWDACWQCGHLADGTQGSPVADRLCGDSRRDTLKQWRGGTCRDFSLWGQVPC